MEQKQDERVRYCGVVYNNDAVHQSTEEGIGLWKIKYILYKPGKSLEVNYTDTSWIIITSMNTTTIVTPSTGLDSIWGSNYGSKNNMKLANNYSNSASRTNSFQIGTTYSNNSGSFSNLPSLSSLGNSISSNNGNPTSGFKEEAYGILSRRPSDEEPLSIFKAAQGLHTPINTPTRGNKGDYNDFRMHSTPQIGPLTPYNSNGIGNNRAGNNCSQNSSTHLNICQNTNQNQSLVTDSYETLMDASSVGEEELIADMKLQIEALTTALTLTSDKPLPRASSFTQGATGVEIAHRIMCRIKALREENAYLAELANGTNAAREEAEKLALTKENEELKAHLAELSRRFRAEM